MRRALVVIVLAGLVALFFAGTSVTGFPGSHGMLRRYPVRDLQALADEINKRAVPVCGAPVGIVATVDLLTSRVRLQGLVLLGEWQPAAVHHPMIGNPGMIATVACCQ